MTTATQVAFVSKYRRHKFVLTGTRMERDDHGHPTGVLLHGKEIQFENFTFTTADPAEIAYLEKQCGSEVMRVPQGVQIGELIPDTQVSVSSGLSTANATERPGSQRCRFCGRANFRNKMALQMHEGSCQKKQGAAAEGAAVSPPSEVTPPEG